MRIGSSNIGMESTRRYHSFTARRASVTILAGNAGLRMNPEAEDGTEKKSMMGEDAWQEFYGRDPYAEKKNELKEKLNQMNSRSGSKVFPMCRGKGMPSVRSGINVCNICSAFFSGKQRDGILRRLRIACVRTALR